MFLCQTSGCRALPYIVPCSGRFTALYLEIFPDEDEAAHQSEGHAQDDGKRYHEALVEGAQDEIYEDYADDEHHGGGIACRGFLTRHASELVAVAFGQCLVGCLTHGVNCLPRTVAIGWRTIDSYG